jgi:hypothetical protein
MAGMSGSAAVADLLGFFEPPAVAAAVEELLLPIAAAREWWSLQKLKLGCAAMAGCNFLEGDGGGRMGKKF